MDLLLSCVSNLVKHIRTLCCLQYSVCLQHILFQVRSILTFKGENDFDSCVAEFLWVPYSVLWCVYYCCR